MVKLRVKICCALASLTSLAGLALGIVGFVTNHWQEFEVDRTQLSIVERLVSSINEDVGRFYYSRYRGIFRECYPDDITFADAESDAIDSNCFNIDLEVPDDVSVSDDYDDRYLLIRCCMGFFFVSLAFVLAVLVLQIILFIRKRAGWALIAALCALLAGIFMATAIAFYLGADVVEKRDDAKNNELLFRTNWSDSLDDATTISFSWSFILSWVAVALCLASAAFHLSIGTMLWHKEEDDSDSDRHTLDSAKSKDDDESPYFINKAYAGINPVYWPYERPKRQRSSRRAVLAVPSLHSVGDSSHGNGAFFYGSTGALPAVGYVPAPVHSSSRGKRH